MVVVYLIFSAGDVVYNRIFVKANWPKFQKPVQFYYEVFFTENIQNRTSWGKMEFQKSVA